MRIPGTEFGLPEELELEDYLLLGSVLAMPWAFGGVEIWAYRSAGLLLACAAAVALVKHGWAGLGLDRKAKWLLPALLLGLWAAIQLVPLPAFAVRLVSPTAHAIYADTFPGYSRAAPQNMVAAIEESALRRVPETQDVPAPPRGEGFAAAEVGGRWSGWRPIGLSPSIGADRLLWYVALLLGFLVVRRRTQDPEVAHHYRNALFIVFLALALFGLIYAATSNGKLYWIREAKHFQATRPFGPYVNPTNFAGVMELAVPWLTGAAIFAVLHKGQRSLAELRTPIFAAGALLCFVAGFATASKFAAVLLLLGLSVLLLVGVRSRRMRIIVSTGVLALWLGATLTLALTPLGQRARDFIDTAVGAPATIDRLITARAAVSMLADYPVMGSGFGSFEDVFSRYLPAGEHATWAQLHNDYLQVFVEGGVVAGLLMLWLTWNFWSRLFRGARDPSGAPDLEAVGMMLGLMMLSLHALVDFNHQIPANALLFTTLAAIAVARAETGHHGEAR